MYGYLPTELEGRRSIRGFCKTTCAVNFKPDIEPLLPLCNDIHDQVGLFTAPVTNS